MTWQVPWVISGVTEVPLDVARVMAYAATGGQEGVIGSADLKVTQLGTPGSSVQLASGAFVALNRYSAGSTQSYIGYNVGTITQAITAAGVGGRTDLLYAHIVDPGQSGGGAIAGPVETRIIQGVGSTVTKLADVPGFATTAGYALARIAVPASGAAVTQAMITDLRQLSQTRRSSEVKVLNMTSGATENNMSATWNLFPNAATWSIEVPSWANRMTVVGMVDGLEIRGTAGQSANGNMRIKAGATVYSAVTDFNWAIASGVKDTVSTLIAGDLAIPSGQEGTTQTFQFQAQKTSGAATVVAQYGTVMVLNITFYNKVA